MAAIGAGAARAGRFPALAKYEVIEEIGHGGMATVYRAHDPRLGRDVALKVIHPHLRDSLEAKARFYVEAKAVAKLRHPNIVEVFDVSGEDEPEQYLVVELVRGATLRKLLQARGAIPPEVAAALAIEILAALAHAHGAGVVHRDIKPENVMLEHRDRAAPGGAAPGSPSRAEGDRVSVKLTDFGIAKLLDAQGVTSTGQVLGSPAHMAPEQIEGGDVDARADVFGLGVLLYECMVGHLPFEGNNPAQVLRRVLEGLYPSADREQATIGKRWSVILDRALSRLPDDRFRDANAMRDALLAELRSLGIDASRAELEAWLDDPDGYAAAHDAKRIARLCELGREARKRGDAMDAAAHFNRALAYAPHDVALLRIVSSMHRARAWRGFVMRLAPILVVSLALGVLAFFVTRALKPRLSPVRAAGSSVAAAEVSASLASGRARDPGADAKGTPSASARVTPPPVPPQRVVVPIKAIERRITLDRVTPQFGVRVAIDGAPAGEAHQGLTLVLDGKPHELRFTCVKGAACEPSTIAIPAGDEPEVSLPVKLEIKPALLVVDGDPSLTYGVEEFPSVVVRVGVPTPVPVKRGNYVVHVVERPSGRRVEGKLDPGKEARVDFQKAFDGPPAVP